MLRIPSVTGCKGEGARHARQNRRETGGGDWQSATDCSPSCPAVAVARQGQHSGWGRSSVKKGDSSTLGWGTAPVFCLRPEVAGRPLTLELMKRNRALRYPRIS